MSKAFTTVQPPLEYLAPRFTDWVYRGVRFLAPAYARFVLRIRGMHVEGMERLVGEYARFSDGKSRLVLAFRHPTATDPQAVWYLTSLLLPRAAARAGVRFSTLCSVLFLYGRGVPLWAGSFVKWLLPRIGALQVYHRKMDTRGMRTIRETFADGRFPLAMAPEGQVTYHNHAVAPLEHGVARMSLWCLNDLRRAGRDEEVVILPVGLDYRYGKDPWKLLDSVLTICERETGLEIVRGDVRVGARNRILRLIEHVISALEAYYSRFFGIRFPESDGGPNLQSRIDRIVRTAIGIAEDRFGIEGAGDIIPRLFTVRQAFWDGVFREDIDDIGALSPLEKSLADRGALLSNLHNRHQELVDNLVYLDLSYIDEPVSVNRLIETALDIHGIIGRSKGGDISGRILPDNTLTFRIGEPIRVSDFDVSRKGRKSGIDEITGVLYSSLMALSEERNP